LLYIMLGIAILAQWISARRKTKAAVSVPFSWRLLVFDDLGRLYAEKTAEPGFPEAGACAGMDAGSRNGKARGAWDSPARGKADGSRGAAGFESALGGALAGLGIGAASPIASSPLSPREKASFAIRPLFILNNSGSILPSPGAPDSRTLPDILSSMEEGSELVLAIVIPASAFPKGVDPTERRLWPLADLQALAAEDGLAPSFARILRVFTVSARPLRGDEGTAIVSDTNDALV
jgi:hypothetical protein